MARRRMPRRTRLTRTCASASHSTPPAIFTSTASSGLKSSWPTSKKRSQPSLSGTFMGIDGGAPPAFHLGAVDASILIAYVVALAGIGWRAARRTQQTTDDYFLAGRSIPWLITTASFFASCISALTLIGTPAEGYS